MKITKWLDTRISRVLSNANKRANASAVNIEVPSVSRKDTHKSGNVGKWTAVPAILSTFEPSVYMCVQLR